MPPENDLMDTNIFVHMIRNDATGRFLKEKYQLLLTQPTPAYCIVTEGELRSLIYWFKWGEDKSEQVRYYLEYFRPISIETPAIYDAYASIDHYSKSRGIKMGKNDPVDCGCRQCHPVSPADDRCGFRSSGPAVPDAPSYSLWSGHAGVGGESIFMILA